MKILFDLVSIQGFYNGGAEYVRKVLTELLRKGRGEDLVGLYDSRLRFMPEDEQVCGQLSKCVDIASGVSPAEVAAQEGVGLFFIGISQRWLKYDLHGMTCPAIVVMHDLGYIEIADNRFYEFERLIAARCRSKSLPSRAWRAVRSLWQPNLKNSYIPPLDGAFRTDKAEVVRTLLATEAMVRFCAQDNVTLVTVSDYSARSIRYYFPELRRKNIRVLWAPLKETACVVSETATDGTLCRLLAAERPYFLIVSADRVNKNAGMAADVFRNFREEHPEFHLLALGIEKPLCEGCIAIPSLSDADMELALRNAYALIYSSVCEGFGYPPVESLRAGVPVLCSDVSSMPEVLENDVLWFSPYSRSDLFRAMSQLEADYPAYRKNVQSGVGLERIRTRQERDFNELMALFD